MEERVEQGAPQQINLLVKTINGTDLWKDGSEEITGVETLARLLKEETAKRLEAEKKVLQLSTHLNFSQKTALIGSFEADLTEKGHHNVFWADEVFKILGYKPGEITATFRHFFSAIHPEDRLWAVEKLENLIKMGGSFEIEHRLASTDGIEKIVLNTVEVLVDEETKEPFKLIGTVQDITEKRKKDKDLISLNYDLKTLFENMQETFFSVDMTKYSMLQISKACEEIYGYTVEDFMANSNLWFEIVLEEDKEIIRADYPAMHEGNSILQQYRILTKQGHVKWVESRINPTVQQGKLVRLDGLTTDITKRKSVEIALQNNEQKFRTLIENCSDGITVANEQLEFVFASNSMSRLSGFLLEELIGKKVLDFLLPEETGLAESIAQMLTNNPGKPFPIKGSFRKKNGGYFFYEGHITNLLQDPVIEGIVCNFHDVTEREKAEDAVKASNIELKKTNKELDRFVYSVSHDLRAPLASILGGLEYAETETNDANMLKSLRLMKGSAQKLDGFVVDILNYSRNSRIEIKNELIDFLQLFNEVRDNLKYMHSKQATVDIWVRVENEHVFYSDRSRLSIIINNLVSNAIRYCNPAAATRDVEISVRVDELNATIVIKDNGLGIDKKFHNRIFDMFYRLSKKSEGSGLGLYIVKETVEKLQGSIHLESEPGLGSEFTICIPNTKLR
ncbi:MAG: hypothetical protein JWQ96_3333 [Segetibacter sp.]|nr:hypothetical protein [Segetibacter sp.]